MLIPNTADPASLRRLEQFKVHSDYRRFPTPKEERRDTSFNREFTRLVPPKVDTVGASVFIKPNLFPGNYSIQSWRAFLAYQVTCRLSWQTSLCKICGCLALLSNLFEFHLFLVILSTQPSPRRYLLCWQLSLGKYCSLRSCLELLVSWSEALAPP